MKIKLLGKTPLIIIINAILTIVSIILANTIFYKYKNILMLPINLFISTILLTFSILCFYPVFFDKKVKKARSENKLITFGVYAYVRNPLYTSYLFLFSVFIIIQCNITIYITLLIMYLIQNFLLIKEEKEMENKFGIQYIVYKKRVNKNLVRIQKIF